MRIPTYIRRQISIHDPLEIGIKNRQAPDAESGNHAQGVADEAEDQIQKGLSDLPAYLRRKNNGA